MKPLELLLLSIGLYSISATQAAAQLDRSRLIKLDKETFGKEYAYSVTFSSHADKPTTQEFRKQLYSKDQAMIIELPGNGLDRQLTIFFDHPSAAQIKEGEYRASLYLNYESYGVSADRWEEFSNLPSLPLGRGFSALGQQQIRLDGNSWIVSGSIAGGYSIVATFDKSFPHFPRKVIKHYPPDANPRLKVEWNYEGVIDLPDGSKFPKKVVSICKYQEIFVKREYTFESIKPLKSQWINGWLKPGFIYSEERVSPSIGWTYEEIIETAGRPTVTLAELLEMSQAKLNGYKKEWSKSKPKESSQSRQGFVLYTVLGLILGISLILFGLKLMRPKVS